MSEAKKPDELFRVTVAEGKYTVVVPVNGGLKALRYGEKWRDCTGDNLIYALAAQVEFLEGELSNFRRNATHRAQQIADEMIAANTAKGLSNTVNLAVKHVNELNKELEKRQRLIHNAQCHQWNDFKKCDHPECKIVHRLIGLMP